MVSKKINVGMMVVAITPKLHHIQIKKRLLILFPTSSIKVFHIMISQLPF